MARGKSSPDSSNNNSNDTSNSNNTSPDRLNNISSPNPTIIPNNPPRVYSPHDPRCIDCGHRRLECDICTPEVANFKRLTWKERKALIRKRKLVRYCCNCTGVSEFSRNCDCDDDEKNPLAKHEPSESEAATQLRYFLLEALKGEQKFCPPQLCDVISHPNPGYHAENTASGSPAITAMSCRIPQPTIPNTVSVLQLHLRQVSNIVQRLVSLLSSEGPIDEALLNTILRTLFNRLAILNHRAFPSLAKASSTGSKARQHMSQVARDEVQTAYRELWYQTRQSGFLKRFGSHDSQLRGLRVGEVELRELLVGLDQRAAVWGLLFRAKELADKLQFWRAVVMTPRSM